MTTERTFGWVQDPGKFSNLRRAVSVFDSESALHRELRDETIPVQVEERDGRDQLIAALRRRPLRLSYRELVGTTFKPRPASRCNGIMQAAIAGQRRAFLLDWPADNFVRWAHALGFVSWSAADDRFKATEAGIQFSRSVENSKTEYDILAAALLSYPPVGRILSLLAAAADRGGATKFELGRQLGFRGENGFTTISERFFAKEFALEQDPQKRRELKTNWEGSADKYARMICGWLANLKHPWTRRVDKTIAIDGDEEVSLSAFALTRTGFETRKKLIGASSMRRADKLVHYGMLCVGGPARSFLRGRRARILAAINRRPRAISELRSMLASDGFDSPLDAIEADLHGLENIGLDIEKTGQTYRCRDRIRGLEIPQPQPQPSEDSREREILRAMEECGSRLQTVPRDFLVLIQMAFDRRQSRQFESKIIELLTEHCGFGGFWLGGANRPDGVVFADAYGVIIDAKSYKDGFNIPIGERDKMRRYVDEATSHPLSNSTRWWENFPPATRDFLFLFVSGRFGGAFRNQLRALGEETRSPGAAISARALILTADKMASATMTTGEFKNLISCLDEAQA